LQLTSIRLAGIIDEAKQGKPFFDHEIAGMDRLQQPDWDRILLTRLEGADQDIKELMGNWVNRDRITAI
jgi:hypothetical protein